MPGLLHLISAKRFPAASVLAGRVLTVRKTADDKCGLEAQLVLSCPVLMHLPCPRRRCGPIARFLRHAVAVSPLPSSPHALPQQPREWPDDAMCDSQFLPLLMPDNLVLEVAQGDGLCLGGRWVRELDEGRRDGGASHGPGMRVARIGASGLGQKVTGDWSLRRTAAMLEDRGRRVESWG